MGYSVMYCAESEVFHLGGGTLNVENPFKTYLNFRNNLLLLANNLPFWRASFVIIVRIWMDLLALFRFLSEGKRRDAWAVSRAHQNFVTGLFKANKTKRPEITHHAQPNKKGIYKGSLVWAFFVKKKRHFTELDRDLFY